MADDRAQVFLQMIQRAQRGRLKLYLGYGPGVGKTYLMLQEAQRLRQEGIDVVVAVVETHGRKDTAALVDGLELIPRRCVEYKGIALDEMDVDAVLARKPKIALVDELAHTNVPGSRNAKRYEDVRELLAAGIHVIATLNVQHLESLYNTVEGLIGVKVRERIPDAVVAEADQVVNVDLSPEDLQKRLSDGKIYPKERIGPALDNFFKVGNLEHLRELTMREIASQIDFKRREVIDESDKNAPDQIMVCLASKGPNSARLLRFASRLAGRLNRTWYAVYVQTSKEAPTVIDSGTQRVLADTLTLANQLGATVFTFKGEDVVDTILRFAREYRVGNIVIGRPRPIPEWRRRLLGRRSIAEDLIVRASGYTVIVIDAETGSNGGQSVNDLVSEEVAPRPPPAPTKGVAPSFADSLAVDRILIVDEPVTKDEILAKLIAVLAIKDPAVDAATALSAIRARELQGSTFINECVAVPHARIPGIARPVAALALTRQGISDVAAEPRLEAVFLQLSPENGGADDMTALTRALHLFQGLALRRALANAVTPAAVLQVIRENEGQ